jgi:hypothetical protein
MVMEAARSRGEMMVAPADEEASPAMSDGEPERPAMIDCAEDPSVPADEALMIALEVSAGEEAGEVMPAMRRMRKRFA